MQKGYFASKPVHLTTANFHKHIAAQFDIRNIPTMVLFKNGKEIAPQSGAMVGGQIEQWVESQLA